LIPEDRGWSNGTAALAALKTHLLKNLQRAELSCNRDLACKKPPSIQWKLRAAAFEDGEERQMAWPTESWAFSRGDQFTTVIFHKALTHPMTGHAHMEEMPQHFALTGHYVPTEGAPADYWYVLPSTDADHAWLNSVNWIHALTQYGGPSVELWSWRLLLVLLISSGFAVTCTRCSLKAAGTCFHLCRSTGDDYLAHKLSTTEYDTSGPDHADTVPIGCSGEAYEGDLEEAIELPCLRCAEPSLQ
jgi:hypothetical protein